MAWGGGERTCLNLHPLSVPEPPPPSHSPTTQSIVNLRLRGPWVCIERQRQPVRKPQDWGGGGGGHTHTLSPLREIPGRHLRTQGTVPLDTRLLLLQ